MPRFDASPQFEHGQSDSLGILLVNLGTPDAPTTTAVRRYLAEFLWDPRVVEVPRPIWWLVLNGFILRFRPSRSASAYRKIWSDQGSPLLVYSRNVQAAVQHRLSARLSGEVVVELGMSYGNPSIDDALQRLHDRSARRIVVLPMYPQYSGTTTGSVFDAVTHALSRRRWVPELRFINHYHDFSGYIDALAASVREYWGTYGRGDRLLMSFHGVPKRTLESGDPYHCHCQKTGRLLAENLGLGDDEWILTFQSRVGREEWLRPYTDDTVGELGKKGLQKLDVVCPGFSVDCLETLEEIAMQNAEIFAEAGGGDLRYIPALNARDDHVAFLGDLIERNVGGWPEAPTSTDDGKSEQDMHLSLQRATAMGASR